MVYIYTLSDPRTNEIKYVGKTINVNKRFYLHLYESNTSKTHKAKWIKSLVLSNYKPIIEILDIVDDANWEFWETYWIQQMQSWGFNLCNLTNGGDGVKEWTIEMRENMSKIKTGCKVWNKGLSLSDDYKHKISNARRGKGCGTRGKIHTEEFKKNKSEQMKKFFIENQHGMLNKKHSETAKKNISEKHSIPIIQLTLSNEFIKKWESAKIAGHELNIQPTNITACCKKKKYMHQAGGYKWEYYIK